jgi:hypothetical protein
MAAGEYFTMERTLIKECDFASQVEDLLKLYGWLWVHNRPARTQKGWRTALSGYKGFPDYVAVKEGRLLFIELKGDTGKPTLEQDRWNEELSKTGAEVGVFYPRHFGVLRQILAGEA